MPDDKQMLCMEVWGGNAKVDRAVVMPGLDAWVFSLPHAGAGAGGDVHYVSTCASGWFVRLLLADVAGHGTAVARIADELRRLMRRYVNDHDHSRFVRSLNQEFAASSRSGTFATAVALTFDSPRNALQVCNAGHPPPLWYVAAERRWTLLDLGELGAVPLGIDEGVEFLRAEVKLGLGDLVLCYTDAFIEAADASGRMIDVAGLLGIVRSLAPVEPDAHALIGRLVAALAGMNPKNLDRDDLTCLLLRPNGTRPAVPLRDWLLAPLRRLAAPVGVRFGWAGRGA